jgi:hypothetical protein
MGSYNIVDDVPSAAGMTWKPELWEQVEGEITYVGTSIGKDFDGKVNQRQCRIDLVRPDGQRQSLWPVLNSDIDDPKGEGYPDRMARAVSKAVEAAGQRSIETGGYLVGQRIADVPPTKAGFNPAKEYVFTYRAPAAQSVAMPASQAPGVPAAPQPAQVAPQPPQPAQAPQMAPPPQQPPQQAPVPAPGVPAQPAYQQPPQQPLAAQAYPPNQQVPAPAPQQPLAQPVAPQAMAAAQTGPDINALHAATQIPHTVLDAMAPEQLQALAASIGQ